MKILFSSLIFLMSCSVCFAQDTNLGKFNLTANQKLNLTAMDASPFKGVSVWEDGTVIAVSDFEPNQFQINSITAAINSLPDTPSQQVLINNFSVTQFMHDLDDGLSSDSVLFQYYAAVKDWASEKKFSRIKAFINSLVANGTITQGKADELNGIFKKQGIDLTSF